MAFTSEVDMKRTKMAKHLRGKQRRKNKTIPKGAEYMIDGVPMRMVEDDPHSSNIEDYAEPVEVETISRVQCDKPHARFPWLGIAIGALVWAVIIVLVIWLVR